MHSQQPWSGQSATGPKADYHQTTPLADIMGGCERCSMAKNRYPLRNGSKMIYIARLILLLSVYTGSFLLAELTGYLIIAVVGGAIAGVIEGLIQTGRIFVTPMPTSTLARVLSAVPFLGAVIVIVASGISWPTVIAYAAPWFLGTVAMFTFDAYHRGL